MIKGKSALQWGCYLFEAETPETTCAYKPFGVVKTFFWVGMSFLMAVGVSSLT